MSNVPFTTTDILNLKQANTSLRKDLEVLNKPFKLFHVSHLLKDLKHHYQGYDKTKYNGFTLLVVETSIPNQVEVFFTRCLITDNYNRVLGSNFVLANAVAHYSKGEYIAKHELVCIDPTKPDTTRELVKQCLYSIGAKSKKIKDTVELQDMSPLQIKKAIKKLTNKLETEQLKLVYDYTVVRRPNKFGLTSSDYINLSTETVRVSLVNRKSHEVVISTKVKRNPNEKDNRQLGRVYALLKLQNLINTGNI